MFIADVFTNGSITTAEWYFVLVSLGPICSRLDPVGVIVRATAWQL